MSEEHWSWENRGDDKNLLGEVLFEKFEGARRNASIGESKSNRVS